MVFCSREFRLTMHHQGQVLPRLPCGWNWHWEPSAVFHPAVVGGDPVVARGLGDVAGHYHQQGWSDQRRNDPAASDPLQAWRALQLVRTSISGQQGAYGLGDATAAVAAVAAAGASATAADTPRMQQLARLLAETTEPELHTDDVTFAELGVGPDCTMAKVVHCHFPRADINFIDRDELAGAQAVDDLQR